MLDNSPLITEPRLRVAELLATIPTLPAWFMALIFTNDMTGYAFTIIVLTFTGYGIVLIGIVLLSNIYRYSNDMKTSKLSIATLVLYFTGLVLLFMSYYITGGDLGRGLFHDLFGWGILIPPAAVALLSIVIVGRALVMLLRFLTRYGNKNDLL